MSPAPELTASDVVASGATPGDVDLPPHLATRVVSVTNRIRKNARHLGRWARRTGVTCYRLYDRDLPEAPLTIDWYEGRLVVWTWARRNAPTESDSLRTCPDADSSGEDPGSPDLSAPDLTEEDPWVLPALASIRTALSVPAEHVYLKHRARQSGAAQYTPLARTGERFTVTEDSKRFWINPQDYLDTGLFLDHRQTRARVGAESSGRRMLNLYGYTGSFSVYAAAAGARSTTTVDLSATYLNWASDNLALNALAGPDNTLVREDAMRFLKAAADRGEHYDLIVCDPPTFSNSKRLPDTFDVHRDHPALLAAAWAVLARGGVLYFSTNHRRFELDAPPAGARGQEITAQTVPMDFSRRRPHRCWRWERP